jgi:hypothetical protein
VIFLIVKALRNYSLTIWFPSRKRSGKLAGIYGSTAGASAWIVGMRGSDSGYAI